MSETVGVLELEDAILRVLGCVPAPEKETLALANAAGRILATPAVALIDLPLFDNSAVDGYAVRAEDISAARTDSPAELMLLGRTAAGERFEGTVTGGTCVRVFTGSPMPAGADAVVMQEDTQIDAGAPGKVWVFDSVKPQENVRLQGEDVRRGKVVADKGEPLTPARIALLGAAGVASIEVGRQPRVAVLATGSELKQPGEALSGGQIYESNRLALAALITLAGGHARLFPVVPDEPAATEAALRAAFEECDVVVTCGGVSVGEMDFVRAAFERLGGMLEFRKVSMRPGRPAAFGRLGGKLLFGLPGNPVSAFVTFLMLVRPAILRWQGAANLAMPTIPGKLAEPVMNPGSCRHFVRVFVDGAGTVREAGPQASHLLGSLAAANGLVDVPAGARLAAGSAVAVLRLD